MNKRSTLLVLTPLEGETDIIFGGEYVKELESATEASLETVKKTGIEAPDPGATLHRKRVCET
jgi:hypothetical protein